MLPPDLQSAPRVFEGVRFDVHRVELPGRDGRSHRREVVVHPGAAIVLPFIERGPDRVLMIRNERFAVGETLWELPCGTLEPPEPPEVCAARELVEETGYRAARVTPLLSFYTSPGICTERMYAYVAEGLTHEGQDLDAGEQISVQAVLLDEAIAMVRDGRVRDGKTIATLLYYHAFAGGAGHETIGKGTADGTG
jgi:ADP-ribose diphosphatase